MHSVINKTIADDTFHHVYQVALAKDAQSAFCLASDLITIFIEAYTEQLIFLM